MAGKPGNDPSNDAESKKVTIFPNFVNLTFAIYYLQPTQLIDDILKV